MHGVSAPLTSLGGPIGSQLFPVKPYNEDWDNPGTPFQDTLVWGGMPVNATLRVTVSGTVTLGAPPTLSGNVMTKNTTYTGQSIGPTGITGTYSTYGVPLQVTAGITSPAYALSIDSATGDGSIILRTGPSTSALLLHRNGIAGEWQCMSPQALPGETRQATCDDGSMTLAYTHPGYYRTSQQTVSVERLEDDVTLTANPQSVYAGDSVSFVANPLSSLGSGGAMGWTWSADSGSAQTQVTCPSSAAQCRAGIRESGIMTVHWYFYTSPDGDASHKSRYASAHVTVELQCPPVDSIMDSVSVRDSVASAWQRSNYAPGSDQTTRWEQGGWIIRGSDGRYSVLDFAFPAQNCGLNPPPGTQPPPGAVAWFHTHPWTFDEKATTCFKFNFNAPNVPSVLRNLGLQPQNYKGVPSEDDQATAGVWNLPGYIIDADGIARFDSTTTRRISSARCGY